ncbi:aminotransferase class I/II-fold pyridoxal phosphate-dependent enzyme [Roseococcus sp. SDR]|uniref:aminotransferase class I/II-fold pyridoxal phosphate-dependent enzyme n=1 Tax=Roseococcus sp. SDR TaxID=2835532 RepID=UPI001BCAEBAC|nr:aminotransferase class I/II-fold pyridoxal phosphate-dependent enzyme [Roseococcus sp. SDR]MBS7791178.1 aminotransferase class I/II-fold pyridoxal phosphate-dependent enzyme [Roseococcus sp. SDR]MBV1846492.1 aminotransferase class I/II-fold pyridoxal phosphate-dependent enzyme [Roseococcus sp. SDR]
MNLRLPPTELDVTGLGREVAAPAPAAGLPSAHVTDRRQPRTRALRQDVPKHDLSFESLPAYREILLERQVGPALGFTNPYYRVHDGRAATRTSIEGRELLNFSSYDYLALNGHPEVLAAHEEAGRRYGTSVSASRITSGERPVHRALEAALAEIYEAEAGALFVSGHATAASVIETILGPKDLIIHDSLIHNCVVVGAQGARCQRKSFRHNDLDDLENYLTLTRHLFERVLIVTEGLFSMDGDGPDMFRLLEIKERFQAWLMVDEAHSLGVIGATGRGIAEHCGIDPNRVDIWFGTLSKTLVGCGGYVCGSQVLIDILKARAPGLVYSVGMPAPVAAASLKALEIMRREPERVAALQANGAHFLAGARARGLDVGSSWGFGVTPVILGTDIRTFAMAQELERMGIYSFPVSSPGVPKGTSRLRFFLSAAHERAQIDTALDAVATILDRS